MDVEDSSDDDGFCPVEGTSRRNKLGVAGANGGGLDNLLQNNKFAPLAENNNNGSSAIGSAPAMPGQRKQPPLVVKNLSHRMLRTVMESCFAKPRYKLVSYGQQIICSTPLEHEVVQKHLLSRNVEFYTL